MRPARKDGTIIIRIDPLLKAELQELADLDKRKLSDYVRVEIEKILELKRQEKQKP